MRGICKAFPHMAQSQGAGIGTSYLSGPFFAYGRPVEATQCKKGLPQPETSGRHGHLLLHKAAHPGREVLLSAPWERRDLETPLKLARTELGS